MTNEQLYLAIGLPTLFNTVLFSLLVAYMHAKFERVETKFDAKFDGVDTKFDGVNTKFDGINTRFDGINSRFDAIDRRFDDMRDLWRAELHRVEEVLDARLKHLEEKM
jgi:hypothetical protein